MRLILLLFAVNGLFLTSAAMAQNQAKIVCKCNVCVVQGLFAGKHFKGYAEHTEDGRIKGAASPDWAKEPVKQLMLVPHPRMQYLRKSCTKAGFKCQIMVLRCDVPKLQKQSAPRMGPADPVPAETIKTGYIPRPKPQKPATGDCVKRGV